MKGRNGRAGFSGLPNSERSKHGRDAPYYPEGGWGYVVVLAAFTALMTQMGLIVSMGIYLDHIEQEFQSGAGLSGWISSGCFAVLAFVSPLASFIMKRLGCRVTAMLGGVIMCAGFVCGSYANSVVQLFVFADVIGGIGASMSHISATVVIGQYFNVRYALANGFAYMGQGVGIFMFPSILQTLIHWYGWRGCMLVQGAISLHISAAAALYRAVKQPSDTRRKQCLKSAVGCTQEKNNIHGHFSPNENQNSGADSNSCSSTSGDTQYSDDYKTDSTAVSASELDSSKLSVSPGSALSLDNAGIMTTVAHREQRTEHFPQEKLNSFDCAVFSCNTMQDGWTVSSSELSSSASSISNGSVISLDPGDINTHHLEEQWGFFFEDRLACLEHTTFPDDSSTISEASFSSDLSSFKASIANVSTVSLTPDGVQTHTGQFEQSKGDYLDEEKLGFLDTEEGPRRRRRRKWSAACRVVNDNPAIYFVFLVFLFETFGYGGFFSHVVANAREMGIEESAATFALSMFGIGSLVGRATNGWIVHRGLLTAKGLNAVALIIAGGAAALTSMVDTHPGVLAGSFFSGLGSGWYMPLQQVLLRDIVGQSRLHLAYGYGLVFEGAGSLAGGFVIGFIRDVSGSYDVSFYFLGVVVLLGATVLALDRFCERRGMCLGKDRRTMALYSLDSKKQPAGKATPV